ncbi:ribosome biogenesis GTPase [Atopostipes suicloacalis DSM 15692]|uniref:Small ribosomal subunit biogenesis GTPase RsgA n=1 Tax=Atopostipes suicloacalis DSM 15692 TaxID=1121025 RepID=A0A1M4VUY3_9LACT|nr:ribosome small subunit-dependent GTPase A [Atopostipes suicloacalis]SHE72779.1 ribosome biogenesis GTPase [Atopostipes suicloacalis DSM 15692]
MREGQITKALSGFYYITDEKDVVYQTRARGVFRKKGITPLVGDYVKFESENQTEGTLVEVKPRKNELVRPPIANVDIGVIVASVTGPNFSVQLLDRFLIMLEYKHIDPIIYVSKLDIADEETVEEIEQYKAVYEKIGYPFITLNVAETENLKEEIKKIFTNYFENKLAVFIGQSGAGKSTLLNFLNPAFNLITAETSKSLGRGKHTTRHVELLPLLGGLFADTPGFSALSFPDIEKEELSDCFPEMRKLSPNCKFRGCLHQNEPKCAVKDALETGEVAKSRYENYLQILIEIQNRKPMY